MEYLLSDSLCSSQEQVKVDGGKALDLINYPYIFMVMYDQSFDQLVI